jgi:hypothetical protein
MMLDKLKELRSLVKLLIHSNRGIPTTLGLCFNEENIVLISNLLETREQSILDYLTLIFGKDWRMTPLAKADSVFTNSEYKEVSENEEQTTSFVQRTTIDIPTELAEFSKSCEKHRQNISKLGVV